MKFKNKSASNNDSPTSNSIDGEAPTTKRKKRKTDLKTIPSSTDIESNGNTLGIASVTRKKKKEQQQHYSELNHDSSVDIATNNNNMNNNNMIPSNNNNGCISNETNEKEMDEQSINSSYQVIVNEPNSQPLLNNNMHHHTTYSTTTTSTTINNIQVNYRSREEIVREERYATKRRFNFLVRLVEEMVDEEEIHYHYQLYLKQQEELKRNPSLCNSTNSAIQSLEYLEEDDEESSTLSSSSNNQEEDQIITNEQYR